MQRENKWNGVKGFEESRRTEGGKGCPGVPEGTPFWSAGRCGGWPLWPLPLGGAVWWRGWQCWGSAGRTKTPANQQLQDIYSFYCGRMMHPHRWLSLSLQYMYWHIEKIRGPTENKSEAELWGNQVWTVLNVANFVVIIIGMIFSRISRFSNTFQNMIVI